MFQLTSRRVAAVLSVALVLMIVWHWYPARSRAVLENQSIDVRGKQRHYRLVIPTADATHGPVSLLIALPGAGDTARDMARYTQLDQLADKHACYVAYLEARHLSWPPSVPPDNPDYIVPDLEFFDAVCNHLVEQHGIDRRSIYVVGISQGGAFANLLVAKRSDRIAAATCHSGWLPDPLPETGIHAEFKTPMLFVAGSDDTQVSPRAVGIGVECFRNEGHEVEYWEIPGLGHGWCQDVGFNERVWRFLSRYRLGIEWPRS